MKCISSTLKSISSQKRNKKKIPKIKFEEFFHLHFDVPNQYQNLNISY